MVRFVVKERDLNEPCFVIDEDAGLILELNPPADLEGAKAFAAYLNGNVRKIRYDTSRDKHPPEPIRG